MSDSLITWLQDFIAADKYKQYDGPTASSPEDMASIEAALNQAAHDILSRYLKKKAPSPRTIRTILRKAWDSIVEAGYDTDDREFAYDPMSALAEMNGIDPKTILLFYRKDKSGRSPADYLQQYADAIRQMPVATGHCIECGQLHQVRMRSPDMDSNGGWLITQCAQCQNIDFLELPYDAQLFDAFGASWLEFLGRDSCSRTDASLRVEILMNASGK